MSFSLELDQRIAATAFGVAFGVPVHPGRNPAAKAAITPAQLATAMAADARQKKRRPLSDAQTIVAIVGEMIEQKNWNGLLNIEHDALEVAAALRRSSPADAAAIYGFLGHAHVTTMRTPVAIYADHGGVSGWSDPPNASKSLHSRQKCVRPCYQGNVNRMLVDQPADFVQKYANAPHHRAVPCPPSLFPGTQVGGSGIAAAQGGDAAQAIDHYLTALSIARETRDRAVEGEVCHSLGMIYRNVGDYPKAIAYHDMRLAIANEIGDSAGQGNAYFSLGLCFFSLERYRKAVTMFEECLKIAQERADVDLQRKASDSLSRAQNMMALLKKQGQHYVNHVAT